MKKLGAFILIYFIIPVVCFAISALEKENFRMWYDNARYYFTHKKNYFKALECIERALKILPDDIKALRLARLIRKKLKLGQPVSALAKEQSDGWVRRGIYEYKVKKNYKKALTYLEKAVIFNPENKVALDYIKRIREASKFSFKKDIKVEKAIDYYLEARNFLIKEKWGKAKEALLKGIKSDPSNIKIFLLLLHLTIRFPDLKTEKEMALAFFKYFKLAKLKHEDKERLIEELDCIKNIDNLTFILKKVRRDEAIRRFFLDSSNLFLIKNKPVKVVNYIKRRSIPLDVLDMDALIAAGYLKKKLKCPKGGVYFINKFGNVECSYHGLVKDIKDISPSSKKEKVIIRNITRLNTLISEAKSFLKQKRYKKALESFKRALKIKRNISEIHKNIGKIYFILKDFQQAIIYYKKAVKLNPADAEALVSLGRLYALSGRYKVAIDEFKKSLEVKKDSEVLYDLGVLYYRENQLSLALSKLKEAKKIDPSLIGADYYIGLIYLKRKNLEKSLKVFKNLLKKLKSSSSLYRKVKRLADLIEYAK